MTKKKFGSRGIGALRGGVSFLAVAGVMISHSAVAQDRVVDVDSEIVVTAQKREQNVFDVPISVDVIGGDAAERQNIAAFEDISQFVSNFRFTDQGSPGTNGFVVIRGLANGIATVEPRAAVYIDGVPTGDFFSLDSELFDVERIEVLRGPQSTLYGLNSQAGVVNIVSRLPGDEFRLKASAEYNNLDEFSTNVSMSTPLVEDILSIGASVSYREGGEYIDNVVTGEEIGGQEAFAGRLHVLFTPSEDWEFLFTGFHQDVEQDSGRLQLPLDQEAFGSATGVTVGDFETSSDNPGFAEAETTQVSLRATYSAPNFDVVSVSSYRWFDTQTAFDLNFAPGGFSPLPIFTFDLGLTELEVEQFYQELRVQSTGDGPIEWVVGASFFDFEETSDLSFDGELPLAAGVRDGNTWGFFGQATYRTLADRLGLTAGLRYEQTKRAVVSVVDPVDLESDDSIILPRFVIDYNLTDDVLAYASATRGWLSGGVDVVTDADRSSYDAEKSWTYEVGVRGRLADGALSFKAAGYYTDITDYQDLIFVGGIFDSFLANADEASIRGFEFELVTTPIEGLTFTGAIGYADAQFDEFLLDELFLTRVDGNKIPSVPEYDFAAIVNYSLPMDFFAQAEFTGGGEYALDQENTVFADAYQIVNLRAGYQGERFSALAYVENLADTQYFLNAISDPIAGVDGAPVGIVGRPRTFGIRLTVNN